MKTTQGIGLLLGLGMGVSLASGDVIVVTEFRKFLADDGASGDNYGSSVDYANGILAIGANFDDDDGTDSGSVYLHSISGTQLVKLVTSTFELEEGALFGTSVKLHNDMVYIGTPLSSTVDLHAGAVWVFDEAGGSHGSMAGADTDTDDLYGHSIAMDDDYIVVGAWGNTDQGMFTGAVYVSGFEFFDPTYKILPANAATFDFIGYSVAIDDGIIAIGAPVTRVDGVDAGVVYIYDASTGLQINMLVADDGESFDLFGHSVDIQDGIVVVGAPNDDDNGNDTGSAYVFNALTGVQTHKLLPDSSAGSDSNFGESVKIARGVIAVGAPEADGLGNLFAGAVYMYDSFTGNLFGRAHAFGGSTGDMFGISIALNPSVLTVGASGESTNGEGAGAAYVVSVPGGGCPGDINHDRKFDFFDVSQFLSAFIAQHPSADFNGDGFFDFFDVSEFLLAFTDC